jgi:type IV secretion system protein VirB9
MSGPDRERHFLGMLVVLCTSLADGAVIPDKGVIDPRVRTAAYAADQVYELRGVVGYETDIQFEAGESFLGMGSGDMDAVGFVGQENHLFLKPRASRVATNLTVLTNRRQYQFDYSVGPGRSVAESEEAIYVLRFTYPAVVAEERRATDMNEVGTRLLQAADQGAINADYWYCGHPSLKPVSATDNGNHTRLRFSAQAELPAIFVRNADGTESLLNFNIVDGDVIIHRVARQFVLRRGRITGCVTNAAFTGGGERLRSGTVSPEVRRETVEVAP